MPILGEKSIFLRRLVVFHLPRALIPHVCKHSIEHRGSDLTAEQKNHLLELTEDVCTLWKDPTRLQYRDSESEGTAQFQVVANLFRKPFHYHLTIEQSV
jgi:hypothetical protein